MVPSQALRLNIEVENAISKELEVGATAQL